MCGIFGFVLRNPLPIEKVFQILKKLETSKEPDEDDPLGGYGAGIAVMLPDGDIIAEKVGKTVDSPAAQLEEIVKNKVIMNAKLTEASVLLGHVRFPTPENFGSVKFREAAQPYIGHFESELTVVSVHNGKVENYKELKDKLGKHVFESEKVGFIDSEVLPHYFGEILNETDDSNAAAYELMSTLKGEGNFAALLQVDEENAFLHLIYKGKAEGLIVWANDKGEVIFCSRPDPVEDELKEMLAVGRFRQKVNIRRTENAGLKLSFAAILE
jgi:glucosamine 6-phosphate synthetase-like amidotransferase/phosphosugar isomerase protein